MAKHHTRDLFRLETLPFYNAASDEGDFRRYLRGDPAPSAQAKRPWQAHPGYHCDSRRA